MRLSLALLAGLAMAQPALADDTVDLDTDPTGSGTYTNSPWDTALTDGLDYGLQGTWTLTSATITAPQGTLQFPTAGHILTIDPHGAYHLDYTSAYFLAEIQVNTGSFQGGIATVPPAGLMPSGAPASCADTAQFFGHVAGQIFAEFTPPTDPATPPQPWLETQLNPAASVKPSLTCQGAAVTISSTGTLMPLGAGRPANTGHGMVVPYDYAMDQALTSLIIQSRGMPKVTYRFAKLP